MFTYFLLFLLLIMLIIIILLAVGVIPTNAVWECDSPLNFFMYQQPNTKYSDQLVNLWVDKSWRSDARRIPCRIEKGYEDYVENRQRKLIIYSHGNAEDLLICAQFIRELSENTKMDVLAWDYSGYGLNEFDRFERTPEGVNLTLQTLYDHIINQLGYRTENIIFWGYSLGSGPSTHTTAVLSKKGHPPAGLVLFGAYSSILDVVKDSTNPDIAKMFTERWNNKEMIGFVTCPILIIHGQSDGLINASHADRLQSMNAKAKKVILPNSGHTKLHYGECIKEVKRWCNENKIIA